MALCTMDDPIIEQLIEDSISSANEINAGIYEKHLVKRGHFADKMENAKNKLIKGENSNSRM